MEVIPLSNSGGLYHNGMICRK